MQIKDLTVEEFQTLIRETVEDVLQEMLLDPDEGKQVRESVRQQLLYMKERRQTAKQTISSKEVIQELGLLEGIRVERAM
jgi:siroheme synthase (precorrin-2 oxidase/ferrochelatase)